VQPLIVKRQTHLVELGLVLPVGGLFHGEQLGLQDLDLRFRDALHVLTAITKCWPYWKPV